MCVDYWAQAVPDMDNLEFNCKKVAKVVRLALRYICENDFPKQYLGTSLILITNFVALIVHAVLLIARRPFVVSPITSPTLELFDS
jgi:hypothetical protein